MVESNGSNLVAVVHPYKALSGTIAEIVKLYLGMEIKELGLVVSATDALGIDVFPKVVICDIGNEEPAYGFRYGGIYLAEKVVQSSLTLPDTNVILLNSWDYGRIDELPQLIAAYPKRVSAINIPFEVSDFVRAIKKAKNA